MTQPIRTCLGCRAQEPWTALVRIVRNPQQPSQVVVDTEHRLPGRGAWLHPRTLCFQTAHRRRAFARALRLDGSVSVEPVVDWFRTSTVEVPSAESGLETHGQPMSAS